MLTIAAPCPRCEQPRTILYVIYAEPATNSGDVVPRETLVQCTHCSRHSIAVLRAHGTTHLHGSNCNMHGDIANHQSRVVLERIIPSMPVHKAPEDVPERVETAFIDGLDVLSQGRWTLAAGSFRTTLDRATKLLWKEAEQNEDWPKDLSPRIQALRSKLDLPWAITDWAHQVRIVGNEIHDLEDVTEDDAKDIAHFAEVFLTYTYTMPKRLENFRERRAQA